MRVSFIESEFCYWLSLKSSVLKTKGVWIPAYAGMTRVIMGSLVLLPEEKQHGLGERQTLPILALNRPCPDYFKSASGNGLHLIQIVVVPTRVGSARDEPVGTIVGDKHPVFLDRSKDDLRCTGEAG